MVCEMQAIEKNLTELQTQTSQQQTLAVGGLLVEVARVPTQALLHCCWLVLLRLASELGQPLAQELEQLGL